MIGPFQSDLKGTKECIVDPNRCDGDGYRPRLLYGALAPRASAYLPARTRVNNGVRVVNSQYAFHVAPQHHPTWAGVLDGVGYGMYVVEIKDCFLEWPTTPGVVDLNM